MLRKRVIDRALISLGLLVFIGSVSAGSCGVAAAQTSVALPFASADGPIRPQTAGTTVEPARAGPAQAQALKITFQPAEWPKVTWRTAQEQAWNWSATPTVAFDVTNPGDGPVALSARIDDAPHVQFAPKMLDVFSGTAVVGSGQSETLFIDLRNADNPMDQGMSNGPPAAGRPGMTEMPGVGAVDPSHIINFQLSVHRPDAPVSLIVSNFRFLPDDNAASAPGRYEGIVDALGQFTGADWPGKVHGATELTARHESSVAKSTPASLSGPAAGLDIYGGWADGPALAPSGFFTTVNRNGKWWLVTPSGHLFLSFGVNAVSTSVLTMATGREKMFTGLPPVGGADPLAQFYKPSHGVFNGPVKSGFTYNFYEANLYRVYGTGFRKPWIDESIARLRSWGFNTVTWSDPDVNASEKIAYVVVMGASGSHKKIHVPSGHWGPIDDPFDPQFAADCSTRFQRQAAPLKDDPWLLGYCVGNEMAWGGGASDHDHYDLAYATLLTDASKSPAKAAFIARLTAKYTSVANLNTAWGTAFAEWPGLAPAWQAPKALPPAMRQDFADWIAVYAAQYFKVVRAELKAADPNHLFVGCRFAHFAPEEVIAASQYCDVVSFNVYSTKLDPKQYGFLQTLGKPCMITEFGFGATDRGMFGTGIAPAPSEAARAGYYQDYVRGIIENPAFVGCDWFQYVDEPLTGRSFDGENFCDGLVTITDLPYPELTAAARETHSTAYLLRSGQSSLKAEASASGQ